MSIGTWFYYDLANMWMCLTEFHTGDHLTLHSQFFVSRQRNHGYAGKNERNEGRKEE